MLVTTQTDECIGTLEKHIQQLIALAGQLPHSLAPLDTAFTEFKQQLLTINPNTLESYRHEPNINACLPALYNARARYEYYQEIADAQALLSLPHRAQMIVQYTTTYFPQTSIHSPLFKQRLAHASRCLVVGCGAIPSTIMLLGENTSWQLAAMDRCGHSIDYAQKILSLWNRSAVSMFEDDLSDLSLLQSWDVIFVNALVGWECAQGLLEKHAVVSYLLQHLPAHSLCVFRVPEGVNHWLYPSIDPTVFDQLKADYIPSPVAGRSALWIVERVS